jgi:hypothetical protein
MSEPIPLSVGPRGGRRSRSAARQLWAECVARFRASGLSAAAFCAAEGIALPTFYGWKRRLDAEAGDDDDAPRGPRLLPVQLAPADAAIEILLPGGAVLRIPRGADPAFVGALAATLGGLSC